MKSLLTAFACLLAFAGCGSGADSSTRTVDLAGAESFGAYPIYFVGPTVGSLPLEWSGLGPGSGEGIRRAWSFIYGNCEPEGDSGCAPPLEIQNWSICTRFPALYGPATKTKRIGSVETHRAGGGLDVYTGRSTVVIFGPDAERLIESLRRVNGADRALPPPIPGAVEGKLACQANQLRRLEG